MMYGKKDIPCDYGECPYGAIGCNDCCYWCGLDIEDKDDYSWYYGLGCDEDSYDPSDNYDTKFYEDGDCQ